MPSVNPKAHLTAKNVTSNPLRKWDKKLRNATTEAQKKKAEAMLRALRPHPPKAKAVKETDEDVFNAAQKYNKQHFKDKQDKETKDKAEKKRSLEKGRLRTKVTNDKKVKQEQESENLAHQRLEYDKQGLKKQKVLNNMKEHEAKLKVDKYEELDQLHDSIMKGLNGNKKKTKKIYNKIIKEHAQMIELAIQGYMDEHEVDYEEASNKFYLQMREPRQTKNPEPLRILDNYAKL